MSFAIAIKYNEEHFHDKEGALFTFQRARDEGIWSVLEGNVDVDDIYARLHNEKGDIERYVPVQDYLKAVCEEGFYYPGLEGDIGLIILSYRAHCTEFDIAVPDAWNLSVDDMNISLLTLGARNTSKATMAWANTLRKGK